MASLELPSTGAFFEAMCVLALTPEKAVVYTSKVEFRFASFDKLEVIGMEKSR